MGSDFKGELPKKLIIISGDSSVCGVVYYLQKKIIVNSEESLDKEVWIKLTEWLLKIENICEGEIPIPDNEDIRNLLVPERDQEALVAVYLLLIAKQQGVDINCDVLGDLVWEEAKQQYQQKLDANGIRNGKDSPDSSLYWNSDDVDREYEKYITSIKLLF